MGDYKTVFKIASGGMGKVYAGLREEGSFTRYCAIKRLHPHLLDDESFVEMFMDEARLSGLLRHPNVVPVTDVGTDDEGPYLVMELISGAAVSLILSHAVDTEVEVPIQVGVEIVMQAARGLHAAHELKDPSGQPLELVHRDISPQNLIVGYDGTVRLADFGVARALGRVTKTVTGVIKGKVGYMAPEQLQFAKATRYSDIYSLGVVLFELLTGRRLHPAGEDVAERLTAPPPDLGDYRDDVEDELIQLVFEMLSPDPAGRPRSAANVAERLSELRLRRAYEEGAIPLGLWVQELLPAARQEFEDRLREGSERLRRNPASTDGFPLVPDDLLTLEHQARSRRGRYLAGAGLATASLLSVLVAFFWSAGADDNALARNSSPTSHAQPPASDDTPPERLPTDSPAPDPAPGLQRPAAQAALANTQATALDPGHEAEAAPAPVAVDLVTSPAGATVFLDGVEHGETPLTIERERGQSGLLRFELRGYRTLSREFDFAAPTTLELSLTRRRHDARRRRNARRRPRANRHQVSQPAAPTKQGGWFFRGGGAN